MIRIFTLTLFLLSCQVPSYCQSPWEVKDIDTSIYSNTLSDGSIIGQNGIDIYGNDTLPANVYTANGKALFFADDTTNDRGLYASDGTRAGTHRISTLNVPYLTAVNIPHAGVAGNLFFFELVRYDNVDAETGNPRRELWRSDATAAGTYQIWSGTNKMVFGFGNLSLQYVANPQSPCVNAGSAYYFQGEYLAGDSIYTGIYKTDGTAAGTSLYFSLGNLPANYLSFTGDSASNFTDQGLSLVGFNNKVYFAKTAGPTSQIWAGDGVNPPRLALDLGPGSGTFIYNTGINDWLNVNNQYILVTAGYDTSTTTTFGGYTLLLSLNASNNAVALDTFSINWSPSFYTNRLTGGGDYMIANNTVFFAANVGTYDTTYLIATNGYKAGTFVAKNAVYGSIAGVTTSGAVLSLGSSKKTYIWDGTSTNTIKIFSDSLQNNGPNNDNSSVYKVVQIGDAVLCFSLSSYVVWQTDATASYSSRIIDFQYYEEGGTVFNNGYFSLAQFIYSDGFATGTEPFYLKPFSKVWVGGESTDWNNANNWKPAGVPASGDDVVIGWAPKYPVVTRNDSCRNLDINFSYLTINKPGNLNVQGYVANYGSSAAVFNNQLPGGVIQGTGSLTRNGVVANTTFGFGQYNIDTINIKGADWDLTSMCDEAGNNNVTISSIINFQSANKLIANEEQLELTKKPYFSGNNAGSVVFENRGLPLYVDSMGSSNTRDSVATVPISGSYNVYSSVTIHNPTDNLFNSIGISITDSVDRSISPGYKVLQNVVNKTWNLNFSGYTLPASVDFAWGLAAEAPGFKRNNCFVATRTEPIYPYLDDADTIWRLDGLQSAVASNNIFKVNEAYFFTQPYGSPFLSFTVASNASTLPIQLLTFTGSLKGSNALLNWVTTDEINTSHFNIQRSVNGQSFNTIGIINAAGNSTNNINYNFTDFAVTTLGASKLYYRLQVVDKDGSITYTNIIMIDLTGGPWVVKVMPNPVKDVINIYSSLSVDGADVTLTDVTGKTLSQFNRTLAAGQQVQIPCSNLATGVYMLTINANNERKQFKVVKQ